MNLTIILILIGIVVLVLIAYYAFLYWYDYKLRRLEYMILQSFGKRTNIIPALYEVTRDVLVKHDQVFAQSLQLRKQEFAKLATSTNLHQFIELEVSIHKELNFIYKVCSKHPKMMRNNKFIYLREMLIDRSSEIGYRLERYKKQIQTFNKLIFIKNLTVIGLFVPISKKMEI